MAMLLNLGGVDFPAKDPSTYAARFGAGWEVLGAIVFAPLVETLILFVFYQLLSARLGVLQTVVISAAFFSALHGGTWWGRAVIAFFPSIVLLVPFSLGMGKGKSYLLSALIHAFHNCYALLLAVVVSRSSP